MSAPQKRVSTQKSKKSIPESAPIPIPPPVVPEKPPSYRQRLIEKVGIEEVRNRERASRLATKERKLSQAIPVA